MKTIESSLHLSLCLLMACFLGTTTTSFVYGNDRDSTAKVVHPISIVQCDMFVNRTKISMRLKTFADDLELIQGVEPMDDGFYDPDELRDALEDHGEFLVERIEVINARGDRLKGRIVETQAFEIPEAGIMSGKLMEHTMGWVVEYGYDDAPEYITIQQDIVDENYLFPSELKLLLKQAGSNTPYSAVVKPGEPHTIRFDWDLPPLSKDASGDEWRDWFEEQRQKTLGITSYSSVYSFIYITPLEVRQEVLIPLANLAAMIEFDQADPSYLEIDEQDAAQSVIEEYFSTGNPVRMDGKIVPPRFDRIDFYGLDLKDFAVQAERRRISMANGRVGIIMAYPTEQIPDRVELVWDKFSTSLMNVEAVVFAPDKTEKAKFSKFLTENSYVWNNPGVPPLPELVPVTAKIQPAEQDPTRIRWTLAIAATAVIASMVLTRFLGAKVGLTVCLLLLVTAGVVYIAMPAERRAQTLETDEAKQVFQELHQNLFRAFDYYDENDVYDALAASTDGPMLQDIYLKMRKSLAVEEQGGAVAHIEEINITELKPADKGANGESLQPPEYSVRCKWELVGTIEHWGHIHQRTNRYDAIFNVEKIKDAWKLTGYETIDEEPGQVKTRLRQF